MALLQLRFDRRLVRNALANGGFRVTQETLKALAQTLLVNHARPRR